MLGDSAAERAFYLFGSLIVRLAYRVKAIGHENLPRGGCLLLPNHITWVDAIVLQLGCPRPIRFIIDEEFYRNRILHPILHIVRAIPINRTRPREAIRRAAAQIHAGQIVCIFHEGQLSHTGTLQRLQRGFEIIARGRHFRKHFPEKRLAIVLPAGKGAVVANLATALANKVPVGLNFTVSSDAISGAIRLAEIDTAVTATQFRDRFPNFPWPRNIVLLDELLPKLKTKILFWWIASILTPHNVLSRWFDLPHKGGHEEAVLLFTSGTSGEPKGVILSHHNIIGNVAQFTVMLDAGPDDSILASLPFFHSFGCTVTLWYPLIEGTPIVTYPNPLEVAKNAALVEKYKITVVLATPTFLRAYLRKAEPHELRSARLVIVGAEKMPLDLSEKFFARFGKCVFEGYGLTETTHVV